MATRIKLRRDTTANWMSVNPILANGEMGIEADTRRIKLGDGATAWMDLKYAITDQLKIDGDTINTEMGVSIASQDPETWISSVKAKANWAAVDGIAYDSMGNLYMSGWEESGYDLADGGTGSAFLIKYNPQGAVLWTKYTHINGYTEGTGVTVDSEDNVIVINIAWDESYMTVNKYTEDGSVIWQKTYIDSYDMARGFGVAVDIDNDIIVVGRRNDPNHDDNRAIFAMKLMASSGEIAWTRSMGRNYTDSYQPSLAIDGDKNIIIAGSDSQNNSGQAAIAKISTTGSLIWSKTLRSPEDQFNGYELDLGSLDADTDGNIYFLGSYLVPGFVTDLNNDTWDGRAGLILKMNSEGIVQWSRIVGPGDCNDLGAQIVYKEGKLYATFQTERKYYSNDLSRNEMMGYTTQEIVLACFDANNGKVLWKNNFGPELLWGYANPTSSDNNSQYRRTDSGRLIAVHKDYVAVGGQAGEYSRIDDNETRSYAFLAQLPADGSEMDLAGWKYKESKHKGQYAAVKTEDYSNYDVYTTTDITAVNTSTNYSDTADNVSIEIIASGANQWDFKPNGDLALPLGGNIEISRAAQGDINVVGYFDSNNPHGTFNMFNSVTTDPDGNRYYVGLWNWHANNTNNGNRPLPLVVKVNAKGEVEWKMRLSNHMLYNYDAVYGQAQTVAYDPASGNIVVVAIDSSEGNDDQMLVIDMNAVTGEVIESQRYRGPSDISPNGITINNMGERFITGGIQGSNYLNFTVTNAMILSTATVDTLLVPRSVFAGHDAPDWKLGPDGWYIDGGNNLTTIDYYTNISGTVREGSGATFTVITDGGGGYILDSVSAGGTNYRVGHKILIAGDQLGGTTPSNDCTIVVNAIDNDTNGTITGADIYGASIGAGGTTYTGQTGTNYNVGSDFTISVQVDATTATSNLIVYHYAGGTNYAVGDVITFPGTSIGGTSTATDIVITALQVGGIAGDVYSGEGSGYEVTTRGTSPLTVINLKFASQDFTTGGPNYTLQHYTDSNAFLAKFNPYGSTSTSLAWAQWIEKSNYDQGVAVDYDTDGNLYWASLVYDEYEIGQGNYRRRPAVVKLDESGNKLWAKTYSYDGYEGQPAGLQVDSEDRVVLLDLKHNNNSNQRDPVVTRIDKDGSKLWQARTWLDGGEGNGGGLALDNDDNVYIVMDRYDGQDYVQWVAKKDISNGRDIWQHDISNEDQAFFHGFDGDYSNNIATDGKTYHVAGMTFDLDGSEGNAIAVSLPADGSAEDTQVGPFAINNAMYLNEGGGDAPVDRTYAVTTATDQLTLITNRDQIRSYIVVDPVSNYQVYTKSDAGIVFGDGTVQTTSGQGIPQVRNNRYGKTTKLKLSDAGKHLYMRNNNQTVIIPSYSRVPFPVGTVITIVNLSGSYVYVGCEADGRSTIYFPALDGNEGSYGYVAGWRFQDNGGGNLITLLKVEESYSNGSRWVISGNNGSIWN